jgi:hypothetical protein
MVDIHVQVEKCSAGGVPYRYGVLYLKADILGGPFSIKVLKVDVLTH